jgi:succinoglycan biosynthesis transport protein ExoP
MISALDPEEASFTVVAPAFPPEKPVQPRKMLNMAVAGVLGLMIGVFLAFFLHYWETSK